MIGRPAWPAFGVVVLGLLAAAAGRGESPGDAGRALLESRCTICHSGDLITQQRLDRGHWKSIVQKMKNWGAPVTDSEAETLVRYLAAAYPPDPAAR